MPTTDDYGQGINIAALTDAPDAATLAKNIANALAQRSNMRFTSASQRNATLTSPAAGMVAALSTEKLLTWYDGTAWAVIGSGPSAWTTVSLASPWTHNANENGNFQWRLVNLFGEPSLFFRGAIERASYPGSVPGSFVVTSTALPASARPTTKRTIVIPVSDVNSERITLKLDIHPTGHLEVWGTGNTNKPAWIGFNGCFCSL